MKNLLLVLLGKIIVKFSRIFNLGNGSTWPGHIALSINRNFIKEIIGKNKSKIILIAGTNGKTTTAKLLQSILEENGNSVFRNLAGANLLNGIASSLIDSVGIFSPLKHNYAIFEVDENSLPLILQTISPKIIILNNLFRDQLDRYGEIDTIVRKWRSQIEKLSDSTSLILNADDPQIASLGQKIKAKAFYFGLEDKNIAQTTLSHAVDSIYCPNCGAKLIFTQVYFSHLGNWKCESCKLTRPEIELSSTDYYPLSGIYNRYNTLAAVLASKTLKIESSIINSALKNFKPAFGRQEVLNVKDKKVQIFLSKNPTSFNESLRTVKELKGKNLLLVLNNRIPDGRDVSWIWDTDIEELLENFGHITVSGDSVYDMALRIKYAEQVQSSSLKFKVNENLRKAIESSLERVQKNETLYILPTYSAMLEVRKILTGKSIL